MCQTGELMSADRPATSKGGPVASQHHASSWQSRPPVAFPRVSIRASRCRRPGCCPPFHVPRPPRRRLIDQWRPTGGLGQPVVRGPMAIALRRSRSPVPSPGRFGRTTARCADRPQAAIWSRHRPEMAPGPAGDRHIPPPLRLSGRSTGGRSLINCQCSSLSSSVFASDGLTLDSIPVS